MGYITPENVQGPVGFWDPVCLTSSSDGCDDDSIKGILTKGIIIDEGLEDGLL